MTSLFIQAFIFLAAAVLMVPLAKRMKLGSVLGYLIAGVIIGPLAGFVGEEATTIQHFAEFGVVMMLFIIGLELEPFALWKMRYRLFGMGGLQLILTGAFIFLAALWLGQSTRHSLVISLIFSLSSTAIVLQTLKEKGLNKTKGGRGAFSVLLMQDIALVPMLALLPLLTQPELHLAGVDAALDTHAHENPGFVASLPAWGATLTIMGAIASVVLGGHYLSRTLFRHVSNSGLPEAFTASALMLIIGVSALMSWVGLSPALGAFLAGVVLANSEFRHELEADIEPFKGLLLGVFFITVGAAVDASIFADNFLVIIGLTLGLMALKAGVLYVLAALFQIRAGDRWLFTLSLAQAGEFGFVLLNFAVGSYLLPSDLGQLLSMVVALSMFLTPLMFYVFERIIVTRYITQERSRPSDKIDEEGSVIIAGIGRFGQIVNRLLIANGIPTVVLDHKTSQIDRLREMNIKSFYGDATRADLLLTAGIEQAQLIVVAIDDPRGATRLVQLVKKSQPHIKILVRAFDRGHGYELKEAGADFVISETYHSALKLGAQALTFLGWTTQHVIQATDKFAAIETEHFDKLFHSWRHEGDKSGFDKHYFEHYMKIEKAWLESVRKQSDT